jgi:hypothetical protein
MKLIYVDTKQKITCPKCHGSEFLSNKVDRRYSTMQAICAKKDCQNELLVPSKPILQGKINVT